MDRTNSDTAHAVARPLSGARLRMAWQRALARLRVMARRVWTSGMGIFLLVLLVIAGSVSILVPPTQEDRSTTPILSATPTPVSTATPTAARMPASSRR